MEISEYLQFLALLLVRQIPMLVIAGVGMRFAFKRRRSLGRVFTWAVWGFGLLIAYAIISIVRHVLINAIQIAAFSSGTRIEMISQIGLLTAAAYPILIAGLAVLARAVFLGRGTERQLGLQHEALG